MISFNYDKDILGTNQVYVLVNESRLLVESNYSNNTYSFYPKAGPTGPTGPTDSTVSKIPALNNLGLVILSSLFLLLFLKGHKKWRKV